MGRCKLDSVVGSREYSCLVPSFSEEEARLTAEAECVSGSHMSKESGEARNSHCGESGGWRTKVSDR